MPVGLASRHQQPQRPARRPNARTARAFAAPVRYADPWFSTAAPDGPRRCRPTVQQSASKATREHDSDAPESRGARSPTPRACHSSSAANSPSDRLYPVYVMQASARHLVLGRSPQLQGEKAHQARFRTATIGRPSVPLFLSRQYSPPLQSEPPFARQARPPAASLCRTRSRRPLRRPIRAFRDSWQGGRDARRARKAGALPTRGRRC